MGNTNQTKSFLQKGQGLRILSIKLNSPFDGKVQPFFDFIIDLIPLQPQRSPKLILQKLTSASQSNYRSKPKDFNQIVNQNQQRKLQIKIVSTKFRNVRSITIVPNRNWNGKNDLIGITFRKQKYDEVFDNYFPVAQIQMNSPIQHAGIKNGQYLLGCLQFQYKTLNQFTQGIYDRFFDKQVTDKKIHLALYDIVYDQVSIKPVLLKRGWGGTGILGCDFLQGLMNKFPNNLKQKRQGILQQQKDRDQKYKIKLQIQQCNGSSKSLAQALKNKKNKKGKHMQNIKNLIQMVHNSKHQQMPKIQFNKDIINQGQFKNHEQSIQNMRIQFLENRILNLQQTLINVKKYLQQIQSGQLNS